jgi:hypothetical protein
MRFTPIRALVGVFVALLTPAFAHQATGIKLTEPTADSITVWTRITRDAQRVSDEGPLPSTKLFDRKRQPGDSIGGEESPV